MKSQQLLSWLLLLGIVIILLSLPVKGQTFLERDAETNGLLDTFSLSFAGNLNFANAMTGIGKIFEGITSFIDLEVVSAAVKMVLDRFLPTLNEVDSPISRMDIGIEDQIWPDKDTLQKDITTVVGAVLQKQECWEKTACVIGTKAKAFEAKDFLFIMAEKIAPTWKETLDLVKRGSGQEPNCDAFKCAPEPDKQTE